MRNSKRILLSSLTLLCITWVSSCNSQSTSKNTSINSTDGKAAKDEIIAKIQKETDEINTIINTNNYLKPEEFMKYEHELNIIADSINSPAKIEMNDSDEVYKIMTNIEKKAESLSNEDALQAKKSMDSSKTIYKEAFMPDMHRIMDLTNLQNSSNEVHLYLDTNSDNSKSQKEKMQNAASRATNIKKYIYPDLIELDSEVDNYKNVFTEDDVNALHSAIHNLESSLDKQVSILQQISENGTSSNQTITKQASSASTELENTKQIIDSLEKKFDVHM